MSESFTALPAGLVSAVAGRAADPLLGRAAQRAGVDGDSWLGRLPRTVADLCREWALTPDGPARHGMCALALPVVGEDGPAMLKVTWPHVEAATEHLALRHWDGRGSVRLLRADPPRWALLLERLDPDRDLHGIPVDEACEIVGDLLRCLHVPAPASIPRLAEYAARRAADFTAALSWSVCPSASRLSLSVALPVASLALPVRSSALCCALSLSPMVFPSSLRLRWFSDRSFSVRVAPCRRPR